MSHRIHPTTAVLIPALNESENFGKVLGQVPTWVAQRVVCDNGSTDDTSLVAAAAGAQVVHEPRRGYGAACHAAYQFALQNSPNAIPEVLVFLDGDNSADPTEIDQLVGALVDGPFDLVIGSRTRGGAEKGALTALQRFGNWLSCRLTALFFGVTYTDLGPFRAIRTEALQRLALNDMGFGWTIQMQVRAARMGLRIGEVPVRYRNRLAGRSKVSGSLRGAVGAGTRILFIIFAEAWDAARTAVSAAATRVQQRLKRTFFLNG